MTGDGQYAAAYAPVPIAALGDLAAKVKAAADRLRETLPAVHVTPAVPPGTVLVVEPGLMAGDQRTTLAMHPEDADRIRCDRPLLALELGLLDRPPPSLPDLVAARTSTGCRACGGYGLVCENHPDRAWPTRCSCGAGQPCGCTGLAPPPAP